MPDGEKRYFSSREKSVYSDEQNNQDEAEGGVGHEGPTIILSEILITKSSVQRLYR